MKAGDVISWCKKDSAENELLPERPKRGRVGLLLGRECYFYSDHQSDECIAGVCRVKNGPFGELHDTKL